MYNTILELFALTNIPLSHNAADCATLEPKSLRNHPLAGRCEKVYHAGPCPGLGSLMHSMLSYCPLARLFQGHKAHKSACDPSVR
eukprot:scaffold359_cov313-Prasinococcus_capsulatus_cf.AAC.5